MKLALELAEKGRGKTRTNPLVGAVIVKQGRVVGEGYHHHFGGDHAEVMAIKQAKHKTKGATLFVTLEPCCHFGKTPPCTEAIIQAGISKVYVAMVDCDQRVAGKGIKILRENGIEVEVGLLGKEAKWQNRAFICSNTKKRPYISLKFASSLDGKIATVDGESKWITSEESRKDAHKYRGLVDAILVGTNTALEDNPKLNNRSGIGDDPYRVLLDRNLKVKLDSYLYTYKPEMTIVFTSSKDQGAIDERKALGAQIFCASERREGLDLKEVLDRLYSLHIGHVLVEGGGTLHDSFVREDLFDELIAYYAPVLIGGEIAKSAVSGQGIGSLSAVPKLEIISMERLGVDMKLYGVKKCLLESLKN